MMTMCSIWSRPRASRAGVPPGGVTQAARIRQRPIKVCLDAADMGGLQQVSRCSLLDAAHDDYVTPIRPDWDFPAGTSRLSRGIHSPRMDSPHDGREQTSGSDTVGRGRAEWCGPDW